MKPAEEWIKIDLHIHTLDDPKDALDYSAHELLERARSLGFRVLAITLHDAVFDRAEVFADAASMGILLIPAAEMRLEGADVILLNVTAEEIESLAHPGRSGRAPGTARTVVVHDRAASVLRSRRFDRGKAGGEN